MMSKVICILLIVGMSGGFAWSAGQCADIFANQAGQNSSPASRILGVSSIYDPFAIVKGDHLFPADGMIESQFILPDGSISESVLLPYRVSGEFVASTLTNLHVNALRTIYDNYGPLIDRNVVADVKTTERDLPASRVSSFAVVSRDEVGKTLGFFRVFDGGLYPKLNHAKFLSDFHLPLEIILKGRGVVPLVVANDRQEKKAVLELGKYFVDSNLSADEKPAVKKTIYLWLSKKILAAEEEGNTFLYAHVASEAHRIAFKREFGLEAVTDPELNGGLMPPEYLLRTDLRTFRGKVEAYLASH